MAKNVRVHTSDLMKVLDVLKLNERHHTARDEMNAATHMGAIRHSPITSDTIGARERVEELLDDADARID